ncbi:NlpC/P60 family protein [Paenibacillus sp. CC-CFT747]|nr:NlpC/P60 family protein [Paenibacillus sp. CC-CFT747]
MEQRNRKNFAAKVAIALTLTFTAAVPATLALPAGQAHAYSVSKANNVIKMGNRFLGVRYQFGAPSGVTNRFDCSSLTQYLFKKQGVYLPALPASSRKKGSTCPSAS